MLDGPDDVLELMDDGAIGVIALVRDAGATFLAPIFHELAGVVCTGGTPRSHIGIVSREFQVPCVMGCAFADGEPADGDEVEVDCSRRRKGSCVAEPTTVDGGAQRPTSTS